MTDKQQPDQPDADRPELEDPLNTAGEADAAVEAEAESAAAASDTFEQADDELPEAALDISEAGDEDEEPEAEVPVQLERLQKILAKSGIASRRHAEELISSGRVQVNGKVVTELGSKADPSRDHIRVDGKLLQGSERHRYFMLNKPKGYVTTVSDPEGRPTIMEFFSKTRERLYPVGRLDYLSEGLLLVTNDGELANKLTRAASNVEKTYLVKISGQPSEEDLDRLRQGVPIAKGKPGSTRVHTAPAEIRPFRPGKQTGKKGPSSRPVDNPWYEVVLIEGRNRELRKMFEEIGHHVEKIRRVGYGPLVLDLEPGKIRELEPEEVENLRKAAEGKYRKPKTREPRKREFTPRADNPSSKPRWNENRGGADRSRNFGPSREFGAREERRPFRSNERGPQQRPHFGGTRGSERDQFSREPRRDSGSGEPRREFRPGGSRPNPRFSGDRPQRPGRSEQGGSARPPFRGRPENRKAFGDRPQRPFQREDRPKNFGSRPPRSEAPRSFKTERPEGRRFDSATPKRQSPSRPFRPERAADRDRDRDRPTRRDDRPRFDRPRSGEERPQNRPPRPERSDRPKLDIRPVDDRDHRERDESRPSRSGRPPFRENQRTFDRPRREARGGQGSDAGPERRTRPAGGQRPSGSRPTGSFKGGNRNAFGAKRNAPGGKQGSGRSSSGRRPGTRPAGNRPKRKP